MKLLHRLLYGVPERRNAIAVPIAILAVIGAIMLVGSIGGVAFVEAGPAGSPLATARPAGESPYNPTPGAAEGPDGRPAFDAIGDGTSACLPRISHGDSWLDACWQAWRATNDDDPDHDYYDMEFYATLHGGGSGIRWATLAATVSGNGVDIIDWSHVLGPSDGPCRRTTIGANGPAGVRRTITACEHLQPDALFEDPDGRSGNTSWTCGNCILGITGDREVALVSGVATTGHEPPTWHLSADFGG